MNRQLAYSLIWFLKVTTVLVNGVCEFDWETLQSHTTDQPRERSGSVVECLTQDRGTVGSRLTDVTALCP